MNMDVQGCSLPAPAGRQPARRACKACGRQHLCDGEVATLLSFPLPAASGTVLNSLQRAAHPSLCMASSEGVCTLTNLNASMRHLAGRASIVWGRQHPAAARQGCEPRSLHEPLRHPRGSAYSFHGAPCSCCRHHPACAHLGRQYGRHGLYLESLSLPVHTLLLPLWPPTPKPYCTCILRFPCRFCALDHSLCRRQPCTYLTASCKPMEVAPVPHQPASWQQHYWPPLEESAAVRLLGFSERQVSMQLQGTEKLSLILCTR